MSVAEGAFNNAGLAHHQKGEYARSADLFRKATRADPTSKAAAYNLACALTKSGDLEAAFEILSRLIGARWRGEPMRRSIELDPDFETLRQSRFGERLSKAIAAERAIEKPASDDEPR